jgi:hypothetical protein
MLDFRYQILDKLFCFYNSLSNIYYLKSLQIFLIWKPQYFPLLLPQIWFPPLAGLKGNTGEIPELCPQL